MPKLPVELTSTKCQCDSHELSMQRWIHWTKRRDVCYMQCGKVQVCSGKFRLHPLPARLLFTDSRGDNLFGVCDATWRSGH